MKLKDLSPEAKKQAYEVWRRSALTIGNKYNMSPEEQDYFQSEDWFEHEANIYNYRFTADGDRIDSNFAPR